MKHLSVKPWIAHLLLLLVNLIYGANFSIAKAIMPRFIDPYGFIFYRVSISLVLYSIIYFFFFKEKIQKKDIPRLLCCGFFGIALNQLMFFKGISLTSTVHSALLMILTPMMTFVISHFLIREKIKTSRIFGLIFGAVGAGILILMGSKTNGEASMFGDLCIIVNAISYAIYLTIVKPLMSKYNPVTIILLNFLTGFGWVAIFGLQDALKVDWAAIPNQYYWNFGFVILGATFLVYLLNIIAMKSVSPTTVSSYIYIQPLFAILIAIFFTTETTSFSTILGGTLIILGLYLINKTSKSIIT